MVIRKLQRVIAKIDDHCPKCGEKVNPLLHAAYPMLCAATPLLGGMREPHKDEL